MLSKRFYASSFLFDNMRIMFLDTSLTKRWDKLHNTKFFLHSL